VKIEKKQVTKLRITGMEQLDPIDVFVDEITSTSGQITVNCFGQSWTSFWPSVGERGIVGFFKSANNDYIISYFDSQIEQFTEDWDAYKEALKVCCQELGASQEKVIVDAIDSMDEEHLEEAFKRCHRDDFDCRDILMNSDELQYQTDILPDDIIIDHLFNACLKVPRKEHHKYTYLSKIVDAVKAAL
tara:strand:+ start:5626 stop:6189 length:564 start_codon:yes stop_codon:yes gene_type:complete